MDNNFMVAALMPFIGNDEVSYYADLEIEKLTLLVSLAPFVDTTTTDTLMKLSKLDINNLQELTGRLPPLNADKIKEYLK